MFAKIKFFLLGVIEFRSSFTTNAGELIEYYDTGRELAHKLTFRKFEQ